MVDKTSTATADKDREFEESGTSHTADSYEIKVAGHLDAHWSDWLGGMEITHDEAGYTLLSGGIPDQAALHGMLTKIRDLGLALISVTPL